MKTVIQIILFLAILVLGYFVWESIQAPIRFNKEVDIREEATIDKLIDIRTMQVAFKDVKGKYTGSFDTLINFIKYDSFPIVRKDYQEGWDPDEYTEAEGIRRGLIKVSVTKKSVLDSLFGKDYPIDRIRYIPFTDQKQFKLGAGQVETGSKVTVKVFEVSALYDTLLAGLDEQLITNYIYEREKITKFAGLRVGSLEEATNNAGNWEK
ncbi:MAG: hypothetical protein JW723_00855 [Bacteroidales bacterium]|nr:hypothetical protein [Bacteroidales bacterium]